MLTKSRKLALLALPGLLFLLSACGGSGAQGYSYGGEPVYRESGGREYRSYNTSGRNYPVNEKATVRTG